MDKVLAAKLASGIAVGGMLLLLLKWPALYRISNRLFSWLALAALATSRLGVYVAIYFLLGMPGQSDITVYYEWTRSFLDGQQLYSTKLPSCYAPFFTYFTAPAVLLWDSPKSIVLLAIVFELISLPIWLAVGRSVFTEKTVRKAMVFFIASSVAIWTTAVGGQNQSWVGLFLALSCYALIRGQDAASGAWLGFSTAAAKFIPALFAPALFLGSPRRVRWTVAFFAVPLAIYGGFAATGHDVLFPFRQLSNEYSSGNLPFLLTALGPDLGTRQATSWFKTLTNMGGTLILLGAAGIMWLKHLRLSPSPARGMFLLSILILLLMIVSKKSHTQYIIMCFFPICLTWASMEMGWKGLAAMVAFQVLGAFEQSFWYRTMNQNDLHILWSGIPAGVSPRAVALVILMQLAVVGLYIWWTLAAWRLAFPKNASSQGVQSPSGGPAVAGI